MNEFNTLCEEVLNENAKKLISDVWKSLKGMTVDKLMKFLESKYKEWKKEAPQSLETATEKAVQKSAKKHVPKLNESIGSVVGDWWHNVKDKGYPALEFYPVLTVYLEVDKLIKGETPNFRILTFYAIFWLVLITIKGHLEKVKGKKKED